MLQSQLLQTNADKRTQRPAGVCFGLREVDTLRSPTIGSLIWDWSKRDKCESETTPGTPEV